MFAVGFHFRLDGSFQFAGMVEQVLDASELGNQLLCGFFPYARTTGDVVGGIAHQSQHVDDLCRRLYVEFGFDFFDSHYFKLLVAVFGAVHKDVVRYQLAVVFIGGHHISTYALASGFGGKGADDIVCLVSGYFEDGDAVGAYDVFYDRYGKPDYFRRFLTLGFVLLVSLVPEGGSGRIKRDADVCGLFFFQYIFQGIDESHNGGSIESFRINTRIFDESIIRPVN